VKLLPVIDLMNGHVVRGVAGEREKYQPIESTLCSNSQPGEIAKALRQEFGFSEIYVADLDALRGSEPNWSAYVEIEKAGFQILLDAGATYWKDLLAWRSQAEQTRRLVLATESLLPQSWREIATEAPQGVTASFDFQNGEWLNPAWSGLSPQQQMRWLVRHTGIRELVLLDLARVGVSKGPETELCQSISSLYPDVKIIAGGGVRDVADLAALKAAGCAQALLASSLHNGRLTALALRNAGYLLP